jgi:hypothetical protein
MVLEQQTARESQVVDLWPKIRNPLEPLETIGPGDAIFVF